MKIVDLGLISHEKALNIQLERVEQVAGGEENTLYLLEHPPVITVGRNSGWNHLLVDESVLAAEGIALSRTSRGGDITCHYPGQLVAYPVFRVASRPGGMRGFFTDLEEVVIRTLRDFGLQGERVEGRPGVWIGQGKIASIGIGMRRWTSYHGLSLNVARDMTLFRRITLCGLSGARPTSIHHELGDDSITMQEVKDVCVREFCAVFDHPVMDPLQPES